MQCAFEDASENVSMTGGQINLQAQMELSRKIQLENLRRRQKNETAIVDLKTRENDHRELTIRERCSKCVMSHGLEKLATRLEVPGKSRTVRKTKLPLGITFSYPGRRRKSH